MNNLIYMAKPIYGGWVTFTAHLSLKYNCELFKIGKRSEKNKRKYGYGVEYQNLRIDELVKKENIVITAVDKHYWEYLHLFPENTKIIIHDPTELKGKENKLLENICSICHEKIYITDAVSICGNYKHSIHKMCNRSLDKCPCCRSNSILIDGINENYGNVFENILYEPSFNHQENEIDFDFNDNEILQIMNENIENNEEIENNEDIDF